jgi:hypothetical protein
MSVKKFKFVSPGVFLREIDQSQIPTQAAPVGPTIIGRSKRGPALRPVQVNSYSEFVELFGEPVAGGGATGDGWRDGNYDAPTYAAYAAQAWLANSETINFVRLLGVDDGAQAVGTTNNAGKTGWMINEPSTSTQNGAYGLFVFPSASNSSITNISGTLAAIWYCTGSVPILSGTSAGPGGTDLQNNGLLIKANSGKFTVYVSGTTGVAPSGKTDAQKKVQFSFDSTSGNFIRKVFNTSPRNCDTGVAGPGSVAGLWLGETFENQFLLNTGSFGYAGTQASATLTSDFYAMILPLNNYSNHLGENPDTHAARTGWYFRQSPVQGTTDSSYAATSMTKLFRFIAVDGGDWARSNVKIEIANIKPPVNDLVKYGSFDVVVRRIDDVDNNRKPLESFTACSLDPTSPDFISRKIGDVSYTYDSVQQKLIRQGTYENTSKYIRVDLHPDFYQTLSPDSLPFGVFGPVKPITISGVFTSSVDGGGFVANDGFGMIAAANSTGTMPGLTAIKLAFPETLVRGTTSEDGLSNYKQASFGFKSTKATSSFVYDSSNVDTLRLPAGTTALGEFVSGIANSATEYSWYFTLDELVKSGSLSSISFINTSGSRAAGTAYTATGSQTYIDLLNSEQISSFCSPLQGGTDGFNVFEKEPLRNLAISAGSTAQSSYIYNTYKRAIDTVKDPEFVETNIISVPGLVYEPLTLYLMQLAENRGDCLAVVDLSAGAINQPTYISSYEKNSATETAKIQDVDTTVLQIKNRNLNSSYGAAYYPWVQISDDTTGQIVNIPPSVVALGAMSYTDNVQAPWFAPAGFNRGGLSLGNSGLTVVNSVYRLNSQDRDKLYDVSINPIASFPAEGLVIFGQKTLQATKSALDRINVRRLLLYVKRGISIISKDVLFEPNVEATWNKFVSRADPFLAEVKSRFGVTDFRIVLDSTTTTPDLIDQNIMYAKIFIKPARAIEYIAVDFFITNTGASFAD